MAWLKVYFLHPVEGSFIAAGDNGLRSMAEEEKASCQSKGCCFPSQLPKLTDQIVIEQDAEPHIPHPQCVPHF